MVYVFTVLSVLLAAAIFMVSIGFFSYRSELVTVTASETEVGVSVESTGVNAELIPNINMICDSSFESGNAYYSMLVAGSSGNAVYLKPDAVLRSGFNGNTTNGASIRIVSIDAEGIMNEKYSGTITGYEAARLGAVTPLDDIRGLYGEDSIVKVRGFGGTVLALTQEGFILYDITSQQLAGRVQSNESFMDIACADSYVMAVAIDGKIYLSSDGKNFNPVSNDNGIKGQRDNSKSAFAGSGAVGKTAAAAFADGTIVTVCDGKLYYSKIASASGITKFLSYDTGFIAITSSGEIFTSANGVVFGLAGVSKALQVNIASSAARNGKACFVNENGKVISVFSEAGGVSITESASPLAQPDIPGSITLSDSGLIVATHSDGKAVTIDPLSGTLSTFTSENVMIERILGFFSDKIVFDSGKGIYRAQVLSEIDVSGNVAEGAIMTDDIVFIGEQKNSFGGSINTGDQEQWKMSGNGSWDVYGEGTMFAVSNASYSGSGCARITGNGSDLHALSQKLCGLSTDSFQADTFYRLSVWLRSPDVSGKVYLWLEGKTFGKVGTIVNKVTSSYKQYDYVFAVTDQMLKNSEEIRVNIAFEGTGTLYADNVYLGPDSYRQPGIPNHYQDVLKTGNPAAIRLGNLNFASSGFSSASFYGMSDVSNSTDIESGGKRKRVPVCNSLEDSLRMVNACGSSPWFKIGSCATAQDVNNFLEYLCGSVSSQYGRKRIDNGTAMPWSRRFDSVYIEIADSEGFFISDTQRSAYVNFVISMFSQSEYYTDIKDKTIFLDGMNYDGGVMMSSANSHTMPLVIGNNDTSATFNGNSEASFSVAQYNVPRVASSGYRGEYVNSLTVKDDLNAGRIVSLLISDKSEFAEMFLFDAGISFRPASYTDDTMFINGTEFTQIMKVSSALSSFRGWKELYVDIAEPLDKANKGKAETFHSVCSSAVFHDGSDYCMIISNSSNTQQSFLINDNAIRSSKSTIIRYSPDGTLLTERKLMSQNLRNTLQPGEYFVIRNKK
jgi:hypothetical protein